MMEISLALAFIAFAAWDVSRRYLALQVPPAPTVSREEFEAVQKPAEESVRLLNEYGERLQKVEKWINAEEMRRNIGRAKAR